MLRRGVVLVVLAGCGPVVDAVDETSTGVDTHETGAHPASITAATTLPHGEVSSLTNDSFDEISLDGITFEEGGKLDSLLETGGQGCPQIFEVAPTPSAVVLLVDASQTMASALVDHDGDPMTPAITRWNLLSVGLTEHLPGLAAQAELELISFPSFDAEAPPSVAACDLSTDHPLFGSSVDQLLAYLPAAAATDFQGATPSSAVLADATVELGALPPGPRGHIVVLTDGAPNCSADADPPALFDAVDASAYDWVGYAHDHGITTHVVAIAVPVGSYGGGPEGDAITDHRDALALLAEAGGSAAHFADDAALLDVALGSIEQAVQSCRLVVPEALVGQWYDVIIGGSRYYYELRPELCADNSGWMRVDVAGAEVIELCAGACVSLREHGSATLESVCSFPE
jgi:hypothetical protein